MRVKIGAVADFPVGRGQEVVAANKVIALFHLESGWYALDGICPHAGGPLGQGHVRGEVVTCPWHGWQFQITTGQHCLNSRLQHPVYHVEVEQDEVFVHMPDPS